jgi:NAD(P)-dependent dehydrogenase (short-subunit alcohol dehydrogenase family)
MKKILITGGNQGIGFYMIMRYLEDGCKVAVIDLKLDNLSTLKEKYGDRLLAFECDVCNQKAVGECVDKTVSAFGGIDYAIHNACKYLYVDFYDTTDDDYGDVFNVNYFGAIYLSRAVLPIMKRQSGGKVFYTSSAVGVAGFNYCNAYASSKGALESLAKCMNIEHENTGITFHIIHPPFTTTSTASELPFPKELRSDPQKVGYGIAKNTYKKKFIICYSLKHSINIKLTYLFPVSLGKLVYHQLKKEFLRTQKANKQQV